LSHAYPAQALPERVARMHQQVIKETPVRKAKKALAAQTGSAR